MKRIFLSFLLWGSMMALYAQTNNNVLVRIGKESVTVDEFLNAYQNYPLLVGQQTNLYKCILTNGMEMMGVDGYMGLLTPESIYDDPNGQPLRRELYQHLRYHFQYQNELRLFAEVHHRASLRSATFFIPLRWMPALLTTDMESAVALRMRMAIGILPLIRKGLYISEKKN